MTKTNSDQSLRTNEIQYRLEIDHLKSELHNDQIKIQQLERELATMKFKQSNIDNSSIDNLRELLELKERELNALKEKLDYTKKTHQIELQEAIKSSQFSLNNVKRLEQMDLRHQEKRRELEAKLGKFRSILKPLIDNQQLLTENPIINVNELKKLVTEVDTEEKVTNSLSPIRDCLSLLEAQMKDLHHNIIENHARRSKRWKYKLGFECLSCESRWEVTHDIRDLQEACLDPSRFIESSIVEPMAGCSCPIMIDFIESDVRLCLNDILNEVQCPLCGYEFCSLCNQQYHFRTTCQEVPEITQRWFFWCNTERGNYWQARAQQDANFRAQLEDYERQKVVNERRNEELRQRYNDLLADETFKSQNCRICPHCRRVVQHLGGCNSMICGQNYHGGDVQSGCGRPFDWSKAAPYVPIANRGPQQVKTKLKAPGEQKLVVHKDVQCDTCHNEVQGIRFDCIQCSSLTFCEKCEQRSTLEHSNQNRDQQKQQHVFRLIPAPIEEKRGIRSILSFFFRK
ncbi:unnamed protein product [Rotaria sp. Silwood2]|nr:unnamed protein product [Rotaria sp. Silwood2]